MHAVLVIPARYNSSRFPGKPLALIRKKSLIQRVHERALLSTRSRSVFVATDDERIAAHVRQFGGTAIMTAETLPTGTDRIAAALPEITRLSGSVPDIVINLQGDEPLIEIGLVDRMIESLEQDQSDVVTLACPLAGDEDFLSRDVVKVVTDPRGKALYFSRAPIPHNASGLARRHIGVYGFRTGVLERFPTLSQTPLELAESLEQLRLLENAFTILVLETPKPHLGVDRPEDIVLVEKELELAEGSA